MIEAALKETRGRISHGGCHQVGNTTVYAGIEDSVVKDQQESLQVYPGNLRASYSHKVQRASIAW
jgi:hypothetical protein